MPYDYISVHTLRDTPNLREKYDVIVLGPVNADSRRLVNGIPKRGEPIPWQASELTPNIGTSPDRTADIRGGIELEGLANIRRFVEQGGLFVTIAGNASLPIDFGLVEGVTIEQTRELRARGSVLNSEVADSGSPVMYGYEGGCRSISTQHRSSTSVLLEAWAAGRWARQAASRLRVRPGAEVRTIRTSCRDGRRRLRRRRCGPAS